ncbi:MAG: acetyl/propionyl/methylcrotonyl-CoA carboxylase subunit alpha [Pseudomonadota bacterium]
MFEKILIANRGEIACRIIKTARKMGIATVAVFSDADRNSLHVQMADEAVYIGNSPSAESYLRIDRIIEAIKATGAQAVHPGFGFLSENAEFASALQKANIAFIGPEQKAIAAMGDKIESKLLADKVGVNTIPGHTEAIAGPDQAVEIAKGIGCPVMIKASAGGGGKGMRIAWSLDEVASGFESAANEARNSFGDDRVFIEKFIESPRHIEIQVLADKHGNCIYLAERECSIQRRHQKVIEEAPSPFLDEATRQEMGEQAVSLANAVDYCSAGTVEFVVDKDRNFYFLEMNTRLQVEHPVTEYITGVDLVEQMIRVAANEKLSLSQSDVEINGWAMEARVYAEDPERNFVPSTGRLTHYTAPVESEHVRVDTGVFEGGEISMYYDPMIAKLISWGSTREEANAHLTRALDQYLIRGVSHNVMFLSSLLKQPEFIAGNLTTGFIDEFYPDGFTADIQDEAAETFVGVAVSLQHQTDNRNHPEARSNRTYTVSAGDTKHEVRSHVVDGAFEICIGERTHNVQHNWHVGENLLEACVDGVVHHFQVERKGLKWQLVHNGQRGQFNVLPNNIARFDEYMPVKTALDTSKHLLSPMPGLLVRLSVKEGDVVEAGQELVIVEAMKMENTLFAEQSGTIKLIEAAEGDNLQVDQAILEFE